MCASSVDPDQMPHSAVSALILHCSSQSVTILRRYTSNTVFQIAIKALDFVAADNILKHFFYFSVTIRLEISCEFSPSRQLTGNVKPYFSQNLEKYSAVILNGTLMIHSEGSVDRRFT